MLVRIVIVKNIQTINAGEDMEKREFLHCWWKYKLIQPLWRRAWRFLKKLGIKLPHDPAFHYCAFTLRIP